MILKVKNNYDSWSYFECAVIHSKFGTLKDFGYAIDEAVIIFESHPIDNPGSSKKRVKYLNLETLENHARKIITDRICYVLNSEGKTIDKI